VTVEPALVIRRDDGLGPISISVPALVKLENRHKRQIKSVKIEVPAAWIVVVLAVAAGMEPET